ncbi:MAG: VPLPA-CTERM sorting domain-containing protein [Pseudomonadota bacterium]
MYLRFRLAVVGLAILLQGAALQAATVTTVSFDTTLVAFNSGTPVGLGVGSMGAIDITFDAGTAGVTTGDITRFEDAIQSISVAFPGVETYALSGADFAVSRIFLNDSSIAGVSDRIEFRTIGAPGQDIFELSIILTANDPGLLDGSGLSQIADIFSNPDPSVAFFNPTALFQLQTNSAGAQCAPTARCRTVLTLDTASSAVPAVPLPAGFLLLLAGFGALGLARRFA